MSKETKKSVVESARAWSTKHAAEGLDLKVLNAAVAAVEKNTADAHATAAKLGEILEARKASLKALKAALKNAKAERKAPRKPAKAAPKPAAKKATKKPATTS